MRRSALFLSLMLVLAQIALGLHRIEHRFEPAAPEQTPCGLCAVADHLGDPPAPVAILPNGAWVLAIFPPVLDQRPGLARPAEIRARAPPASVA